MSYNLPVNLKSEQVWASRREHGWEPVPAGACPTVADIPELLTEDGRGEWPKSRKGLAVFVQYWNNTTDEGRQRMASAEMPEAYLDPEDLAAAAAIVHGLCARDDIEIPNWASHAKADRPVCLFTGPKEDSTVPRLAAQSAFVCAEHNVFYDETFLQKV